MSELDSNDSRFAAAVAAVNKMNEGLHDFIAAVADEGEPEVIQNAILMFEAQGMNGEGLFYRQQYLALESNGSRTQMLGLVELLGEQIQHDIRCKGHDEE